MSAENKAIVQRLYQEAFNQGKATVIDEVYAPDVELHIPGVPEDHFGPGPVHQLFAMARSTFPGVQVVMEDLIAEGDKVVARVTFHRPHDGRILGRAPQRPQAAWTRIEVFRLFRGRIVEQWADRNDAALLEQLGVPVPTLDKTGLVLAQGYAIPSTGT